MHSLFILNAIPSKPVTYKIQRIRDGKSFCTRFVTAHQDNKIVYTTQISFHVKEDASISHQYEMPVVKPPEECKNSWTFSKEYVAKAESGVMNIHPSVLLGMNSKIESEKKDLLEVR